MRVCLFGSYARSTNGIPSNSSGELLKVICESQGFETVECHEDCHSYGSAIKAYIRLFLKHRRISYDVMIIPWRGIITLPLARLVHRGPIIYFTPIPIYASLTDAYNLPKNSLRAKFAHFAERTACRWADLAITESTFQIDYFVREYGLPRERFRRLWPAAYEPLFAPLPFKERTDEFVVLYFGTFIPTYGTKVITEAADRLRGEKDITFVFCGSGQDEPVVRRYAEEAGLSNIRFRGMLPALSLAQQIKDSDACLGVFGTSDKCKGSMLNKINQTLSSAKPLITISTPATREAGLADKKNCMLVQSDSPEELARCILQLRDDDVLRRRVAMQGRRHYIERLSIDQAGRQLGRCIRDVCGKEGHPDFTEGGVRAQHASAHPEPPPPKSSPD